MHNLVYSLSYCNWITLFLSRFCFFHVIAFVFIEDFLLYIYLLNCEDNVLVGNDMLKFDDPMRWRVYNEVLDSLLQQLIKEIL